MNVIWKYPLGPGKNELKLPKGAELLTAQMQGSGPQLWVKLDPKAEKVYREVRVLATGEAFNGDGFRYISTFQLEGGSLIFHAFEVA